VSPAGRIWPAASLRLDAEDVERLADALGLVVRGGESPFTSRPAATFDLVQAVAADLGHLAHR
jgi:hypothetical protein